MHTKERGADMSNKRELTRKQLRLRKKRRNRRIIFGLEIFILLILVGGLFVYAKLGKMNFAELDLAKISINDEVKDNEVMKGYTTIALVGIDTREGESDLEGGSNSDTMIIASINNDTKKIKLVSIYRDTYLRTGEDENKNGIYDRANSAYLRGGRERMINMMNANLDLNVTDCVTVDFQAVAETAELLGGIDVELKAEEVEHLNNYCVETSDLTKMDYEPLEETAGVHHLNGVQTVAYARIRYTAGNDFRRAARQREVIYKLVEKAKNTDLATLNKIVDKVFPLIYSTLSKVDIIKMGMSMLSYDIEDQAGYPFDHLYGERVKQAMDGNDVVIPVTLESNAIKLHEFLYPEDAYIPSEKLKAYSEKIVSVSGFGDESRLDSSEDGSLAAYRAVDTEGNTSTE
jgi:LCP family protein required for cell wall assembly